MRFAAIGLSGFALLCACAAPRQNAPASVAAPAPPAAKPVGTVFIRSLCGYVFVVNDGAAHVQLEIPGATLRHDGRGEHDFYVVGDLIVQVHSVSARELGATAAGKSGLDLLRAHEKWEADYLSDKVMERISPVETVTPFALRNGAKAPGLVWRFDLPPTVPAAPGITGTTFATIDVRGVVFVLSAQATNGMDPRDVAAQLTKWMTGLSLSESYLSPDEISGGIKARVAAGEACDGGGSTTVDRRLHLDDVPKEQLALVREVSERAGGVERRMTEGRLLYRNNICQFEITYPEGFKDFTVQDFNGRTCMLNLMTPNVHDGDDGQDLSNAVAISATLRTADYGREEFHKQITEPLIRKGAKFRPVTPPLMEGARHESYAFGLADHRFAGEVVTFERGRMIYSVWFNATPGTVVAGRANFLALMRTAKWGLPRP
jgi:hypothetical protein